MTFETRASFKNFVELDENKLALKIARLICSSDGGKIQMATLIGETGTGKSHLLSAIEHSFVSSNPEKKVLRTTSGDFMAESIHGIRFNKQSDFRKRYAEADLVLIDDIQFLEKKENTQRELLQTMDRLGDRGGKIVLSTSRSLNGILSEEICDRLQAGVTVMLKRPNKRSRATLLRYFSGIEGMHLEDSAVEYVLRHELSSARCIQGAVKTLRIADDSTFRVVTLSSAQSILRHFFKGKRNREIPIATS